MYVIHLKPTRIRNVRSYYIQMVSSRMESWFIIPSEFERIFSIMFLSAAFVWTFEWYENNFFNAHSRISIRNSDSKIGNSCNVFYLNRNMTWRPCINLSCIVSRSVLRYQRKEFTWIIAFKYAKIKYYDGRTNITL